MPFKCADCDYINEEFNVEVAGSSQGALTYWVKCPMCNSRKSNVVGKDRELDLRIKTTKNR